MGPSSRFLSIPGAPMYAVQQKEGTLVWAPFDTPEPGPGEVRIRVAACALNRADLVQVSGRYPPPPGASPILGLEAAGVVDAIGPGVTERAVGDEVMALLSGGGYAERVCCPAVHTLPIPAGFDALQAAAVMEVFSTAWLNTRVEGRLQNGERLVVHAGASGVGTAVLQLARAWGCPAFATVGTPEKVAHCEGYGATAAIRHDDWEASARAWGAADVILCPVGGTYLGANIRLLRPRGRLVIIGLMGGPEATLPIGRLLVKRLSVHGSVLRSRSLEEKAEVVAGVGREVVPLLERGGVAPVVQAVLPVAQAAEAHRLLASNQTIGKVLLTM